MFHTRSDDYHYVATPRECHTSDLYLKYVGVFAVLYNSVYLFRFVLKLR